MQLGFIVPFLFLLSFFWSAVLAMKLNDSFKENNPDKLSYMWGYFIAVINVSSMLVVPILIYLSVVLFNIDVINGYSSDLLGLAVIGLLFLPISWGIIKRYQVAWGIYMLASVILIFGSFAADVSPGGIFVIITIINIFYVKNRWKELIPM